MSIAGAAFYKEKNITAQRQHWQAEAQRARGKKCGSPGLLTQEAAGRGVLGKVAFGASQPLWL